MSSGGWVPSYIGALTGDVSASGIGTVNSTVANSEYNRYIDFLFGDDTAGTGSQLRPWKTLQHAYNSITTASVNAPYTIILTGGNNDTDVGTIAGKPNINLYCDYGIQVNRPLTITGGSFVSNDGMIFTNIIFIGAVTWIRNDVSNISITLINCEFFNGPIIKQTGGGSCSVIGINNVFVNADFLIPNTGSFFTSCTFLGANTTFEDASSAAYYEILGGYNSSNIVVNGGAALYLAGVICDIDFGANLTGAATAHGPPLFVFDSGSVPAAVAGVFTVELLSNASNVNYTAADPSKWASPAPTTVQSAINRLAAVVGATVPIP